jgi:hypothetical protein
VRESVCERESEREREREYMCLIFSCIICGGCHGPTAAAPPRSRRCARLPRAPPRGPRLRRDLYGGAPAQRRRFGRIQRRGTQIFGEVSRTNCGRAPSQPAVRALTGIIHGESPHHLHALLSVAPPHVPHVMSQPIQRATLSVAGVGLRDSAGFLACNPVDTCRSQWGEYMD